MFLQNLYINIELIENIITHGDCSRFPNAIESGIPMSRSLCALWPGLVEVSHPLGVYYPLGACQREVDLHLLIHRPWYPCLREAESSCTIAVLLPLLLWTGSWVVLVGTSTLSDIFLQDCVTPLCSVNESGRLFAMCCKYSERVVLIFEYVDLRQKFVEHSTDFLAFFMVLEISP